MKNFSKEDYSGARDQLIEFISTAFNRSKGQCLHLYELCGYNILDYFRLECYLKRIGKNSYVPTFEKDIKEIRNKEHGIFEFFKACAIYAMTEPKLFPPDLRFDIFQRCIDEDKKVESDLTLKELYLKTAFEITNFFENFNSFEVKTIDDIFDKFDFYTLIDGIKHPLFPTEYIEQYILKILKDYATDKQSK